MALQQLSAPHGCLDGLLVPSVQLDNFLPHKLLVVYDSRLLVRVQHPLAVDALLQIQLRLLTQLIVFQRHLSHELEIILKRVGVTVLLVVVVKLHPRDARIVSGTDPEGSHAAPVHIECADGKEVQEEPVVRLGWVRDVTGVVAVVSDAIEGGRVLRGECSVRVLTMEAFLIPVDPLP